MAICTSSQRGEARGDHGLTPASSQRGEAMSTFSSLLAWPLALPCLTVEGVRHDHLHFGLPSSSCQGGEAKSTFSLPTKENKCVQPYSLFPS